MTKKNNLDALELKVMDLSTKLNNYVQGNGSSQELKKKSDKSFKKIKKLFDSSK